jgi:hypothetical protein
MDTQDSGAGIAAHPAPHRRVAEGAGDLSPGLALPDPRRPEQAPAPKVSA